MDRLKEKVKDDPNLAELNQAHNVIDTRINELRCQSKDDTVRWLSAMHVVCDGNKDDVSRWLQGIQLLFSPDAGFLTTPIKDIFFLPLRPSRKTITRVNSIGIAASLLNWKSLLKSQPLGGALCVIPSLKDLTILMILILGELKDS